MTLVGNVPYVLTIEAQCPYMFQVTCHFGASAATDSKWCWTLQGQIYPYMCYKCHRALHFSPFHSMLQPRFRVTGYFKTIARNDRKNYPERYKVKDTPYICVISALHSDSLYYQSRYTVVENLNSTEWPQTDTKHITVKPILYTCTLSTYPWGSHFVPFGSTISHLGIQGCSKWESQMHHMNSKRHYTLNCQKCTVYTEYLSLSPNFWSSSRCGRSFQRCMVRCLNS